MMTFSSACVHRSLPIASYCHYKNDQCSDAESCVLQKCSESIPRLTCTTLSVANLRIHPVTSGHFYVWWLEYITAITHKRPTNQHENTFITSIVNHILIILIKNCQILDLLLWYLITNCDKVQL